MQTQKTNQQPQNLDALIGPAGRGEYAIGDALTFEEAGQRLCGEVIHVAAPGVTVSGRLLPTAYTVDCGDGFPHVVLASQIVTTE